MNRISWVYSVAVTVAIITLTVGLVIGSIWGIFIGALLLIAATVYDAATRPDEPADPR